MYFNYQFAGAGCASIAISLFMGGVLRAQHPNPPAGPFVSSEYKLGDFNGDGKTDIIYPSSPTEYAVAYSNGRTFDSCLRLSINYEQTAVCYDFNGDGRTDMLYRSDGAARVAISTGHGFKTWETWMASPRLPDDVRFADFNGDGMTDIIYASDNTAMVAISDSTRFELWTEWMPKPKFTWNSKLADFDNDGTADLIYESAQTGMVALSRKYRFDDWASWMPAPLYTQTAEIHDFNGDGFPDLIYRSAGAGMVALNDGGGRFLAWVQWKASNYPPQLQFADFNGDGRTDLIYRSAGFGMVATATPNNVFTEWGEWITTYDTTNAIADFNGDGKADLMRFRAGRPEIALSLGTRFEGFTNWSCGAIAAVDPGLRDVAGEICTDTRCAVSTDGSSLLVHLDLKHSSRAAVRMHDLLGNEVAAAPVREFAAGANDISVPMPVLPAGVYLCRVEFGAAAVVRTFVVMR